MCHKPPTAHARYSIWPSKTSQTVGGKCFLPSSFGKLAYHQFVYGLIVPIIVTLVSVNWETFSGGKHFPRHRRPRSAVDPAIVHTCFWTCIHWKAHMMETLQRRDQVKKQMGKKRWKRGNSTCVANQRNNGQWMRKKNSNDRTIMVEHYHHHHSYLCVCVCVCVCARSSLCLHVLPATPISVDPALVHTCFWTCILITKL